jgi:hypothetical protein
VRLSRDPCAGGKRDTGGKNQPARRDETEVLRSSEVDPRRMGGVMVFLVQTLGKRFVKNAETRALTGLDLKPPTTIAAYA